MIQFFRMRLGLGYDGEEMKTTISIGASEDSFNINCNAEDIIEIRISKIEPIQLTDTMKLWWLFNNVPKIYKHGYLKRYGRERLILRNDKKMVGVEKDESTTIGDLEFLLKQAIKKIEAIN